MERPPGVLHRTLIDVLRVLPIDLVKKPGIEPDGHDGTPVGVPFDDDRRHAIDHRQIRIAVPKFLPAAREMTDRAAVPTGGGAG